MTTKDGLDFEAITESLIIECENIGGDLKNKQCAYLAEAITQTLKDAHAEGNKMSFFVQYQGTPKSINYAHTFVDADEVKASWVSMARKKTILFGYCSVGTWENWRKDAKSFPAAALGSNVEGWAGEKWLKPNAKLLDIYKARITALVGIVDGIDFDNVEICEREPSMKQFVKDVIAFAKSKGLVVSLRSYQSGVTPYCYLAEEVTSQNSYGSYKPKALLFNLEYKSVKKDARYVTAVTNLALDGKKWNLL